VASSDGPTGSINGVVWFDSDNDHQIDAGEPRLPGVRVSIELAPSRIEEFGPNRSREGAVVQKSMLSGGDGSYAFSLLPYGRYNVVGEVPPPGIDRSWDPQDIADWRASVEVGAAAVTVSLAAIGSGTIAGSVVHSGSGAPSSGATVSCVWAGLDGIPGGADQVTFTTQADGNGNFTLLGVPFGAFVCSSQDAARTESMSPMLVAVTSVASTPVLFAVSPSGQAAPSATTATPGATALPVTGLRDSARLVGIALLMIGLGIFLRMLRTAPTPLLARSRRLG
jgi:hypothetical protein